jgi:hypothetical protein
MTLPLSAGASKCCSMRCCCCLQELRQLPTDAAACRNVVSFQQRCWRCCVPASTSFQAEDAPADTSVEQSRCSHTRDAACCTSVCVLWHMRVAPTTCSLSTCTSQRQQPGKCSCSLTMAQPNSASWNICVSAAVAAAAQFASSMQQLGSEDAH